MCTHMWACLCACTSKHVYPRKSVLPVYVSVCMCTCVCTSKCLSGCLALVVCAQVAVQRIWLHMGQFLCGAVPATRSGNCVALPLCPVSVLGWMKLSLGCFLGSLQILMIPGSKFQVLLRTVQHPPELLGFPEGLSALEWDPAIISLTQIRRRGMRTVPEEIDLKGNFSSWKVEPGFPKRFSQGHSSSSQGAFPTPASTPRSFSWKAPRPRTHTLSLRSGILHHGQELPDNKDTVMNINT